ncbi:MAG: biotin--[acetyl-CoA-carboxylase] ligase [Planctomycetaceae bacterium]|jgi:BirA family biotin operon repressor/biotin-[acetyl-CoA-carboxylase] ligase|nr:biotin--[acetyl-CoA-carboxylase] ligase [Planctomycetaceae bacterium]
MNLSPNPADQELNERLKSLGIFGGLLHLESCGSTNDYLKIYAKRIASLNRQNLPFIVWANRQTAGRGRGSRQWWTGDGAFAASILLEISKYALSPQTSAHLSLAVGLAVRQTILWAFSQMINQEKGRSFPKMEIHWPNDIYADGRKIAGILIEAPTAKHLVVGIGVNTNNSVNDAPKEIYDKMISLYDICGTSIDQRKFLYELFRNVLNRLDFFPSRLSAIIENTENHLQNKGKSIKIITETEIIEGICRGVNSDGSLRIQTSCGERAVVSGVLETL